MGINRGINPWNSSIPSPDLVPQYRGKWAAVPYEVADVVLFNNSLFIAHAQTVPGDIPGNSVRWELIIDGSPVAKAVIDSNRLLADFQDLNVSYSNTIKDLENTIKVTDKTTKLIINQQQQNNADTAQNLGRNTAISVATIPTIAGIYNIISGDEAGQVWERLVDGTLKRRNNLEAAPMAAELARLNTAKANLGTKVQADGPQFVDGHRWVWTAQGIVDDGITVAAKDAGVWVREFTGSVQTEWWDWPDSTVDCTTIMQKAIDSSVRLNKDLVVHSHEFLLLNLNPKSARIKGQGITKTVFRMPSSTAANAHVIYGDSGSATSFVYGFRLSDIGFKGNAETDGFKEHHHFISLNGYKDFVIENVDIVEPSGDGIYIGSSQFSGVERHNEDGTIKGITANGGTKRNNRNVISLIDASNIEVSDVYAENFTSKGMPGIVDIEPNSDPFHRIRNITIKDIHAKDCPDAYIVSVSLSPCQNPTIPFSGITVDGITGDNVRAPIHGNWITSGDGPTSEKQALKLRFKNIKATNVEGAFYFDGMRDVVIDDLKVVNSLYPAELGYTATAPNIDFEIKNSVLKDTASSNAGNYNNSAGIAIRAAINLKLSNVTIDNAGKADGTNGVGIGFISWGQPADFKNSVKLENVVIKGTRTTTSIAGFGPYKLAKDSYERNNSVETSRFNFVVDGTPVMTPPDAADFRDRAYLPSADTIVTDSYAVVGWRKVGTIWLEDRLTL